MQLKHIEYFVQTSQFRSFNEAAKHLFISQPSLSAAIATLEEELGFPLFYRSKSGITLTPNGAIILPEAQQMLAIQNHWLSLSPSADICGEVRICAPQIILDTLLVDVLAQAQVQYPHLQIALINNPAFFPHIVSSSHYLSLSLNFYESAMLQNIQETQLEDSEWSVFALSQTASMICINAQNPLAKQAAIYLEQLNAYQLATYNEFRTLPYHKILQRFPAWKIKTLPTQDSLFRLIAKDPTYIGMFSSIALANSPYLANGTICAREVTDYPMPVTLALFFPKNKQYRTMVEVIKNLLLTALTDGAK